MDQNLLHRHCSANELQPEGLQCFRKMLVKQQSMQSKFLEAHMLPFQKIKRLLIASNLHRHHTIRFLDHLEYLQTQ